jgi:hypothetical protein
MSTRLVEVAAQTVEIVDRGGYRAPSGAWVDFAAARDAAVAGTRHHLPEASPTRPRSRPAAGWARVRWRSTSRPHATPVAGS